MNFFLAITDLGDSAVVMAVAFTAAAYLLGNRCNREAAAILLSLLFAIVAIGCIKIAFLGCGRIFHLPGLRSASGHAALSATVYGIVAVLISGRLKPSLRWLPFLVFVPLVILIALSRLWLGFHTLTEIIAGIIAGGLVCVAMEHWLQKGVRRSFNAGLFLLSVIAAMMVCYGSHFPSESLVGILAYRLHWHASLCHGIT